MAGNTPLLFGCIGLSSVLLFGPGLVLLGRLGWEAFELPRENTIWAVVLGNAAVSAVIDLAWVA
ncbi:hypothetical protein V2W45_1401016 [Cenococcum geophilum]